jgi:hypothetical protein
MQCARKSRVLNRLTLSSYKINEKSFATELGEPHQTIRYHQNTPISSIHKQAPREKRVILV